MIEVSIKAPPNRDKRRPAEAARRFTFMPATLRVQSTVLLRHQMHGWTHYDWLLVDPTALRDAARPLWTARTSLPSGVWPKLGSWLLAPARPHRRVYLTYQGPVPAPGSAETPHADAPGLLPPAPSAGRGVVTRVDAGRFLPLVWTPSRIVIELELRRAGGVVELRRISAACWRARWLSLGD